MESKFKPVSRNNFGQNGGFQPQSAFQNQNTREDNNPFQQQYQEQPSYTPPMKPMKKSNGNGFNKKWIAIILVAILVISAGVVYFINSKNQPNVENVFTNNTVDTNNNALLNDNVNTALTGADGNPVQVKWPSDITPTKMELHLDPVTGSPTLMLIGEKSGLGTVVRAHNANGDLTGFWVIVTDAPALENYQNANANAGSQQVTTPNLEQVIADEIHVFIAGNIKGKTTESLLTEHKENLSVVSKKYGKTNEEVLGYYLTILSAQGVTQ